jgi:predicted TIM-barrel fold metal-dependent hydrolase
MIIDSHVHIGNDRDGTRQTVLGLKKNMKAYGVDKAIIFPFDEETDLVKASIALLQYRSESMKPFLRFDPKKIKPEEVERLLAEYPFYGVKLHPRAQNFDPIDKRYYPIYKKMEESGKPLLIHSRKAIPLFGRSKVIDGRYSDPDRIVKLAKSFPDLDIILAHFAGISKYAIDTIKKEDNLFIETSIFGTTFLVKMIAERIGPEKMMFGSDSPYSDQEIEVLKVKKSGLSKTDLDKILYKNMILRIGKD